MILIEGRQKDYNFLINECKQLCEDKDYATDKVMIIYIYVYCVLYCVKLLQLYLFGNFCKKFCVTNMC